MISLINWILSLVECLVPEGRSGSELLESALSHSTAHCSPWHIPPSLQTSQTAIKSSAVSCLLPLLQSLVLSHILVSVDLCSVVGLIWAILVFVVVVVVLILALGGSICVCVVVEVVVYVVAAGRANPSLEQPLLAALAVEDVSAWEFYHDLVLLEFFEADYANLVRLPDLHLLELPVLLLFEWFCVRYLRKRLKRLIKNFHKIEKI